LKRCDCASSTLIDVGQDDPQKLVGAAVGLQMIGRKMEEEKVLDLVRVAIDALEAGKSK